jgi:uncharacterized protein YdeI (BOF family)
MKNLITLLAALIISTSVFAAAPAPKDVKADDATHENHDKTQEAAKEEVKKAKDTKDTK